MYTEELLQLNIADYISIAIVFTSMLISLVRGFFKELISLVIWIVGLWVATKFHTQFSSILTPYIDNISLRLVASFGGLFLSVLFLGAIVNYILSFIIIKTGLSSFDRLLGMVFGFTRGLLLVSVILLLISTTSFVQDNWWKKSVMIPHLQIIIDWLRIFLPKKITSLAAIIYHKQ